MILGESVGPLIDMAKASTWVLEIEIDVMPLFAEGSSLSRKIRLICCIVLDTVG